MKKVAAQVSFETSAMLFGGGTHCHQSPAVDMLLHSDVWATAGRANAERTRKTANTPRVRRVIMASFVFIFYILKIPQSGGVEKGGFRGDGE